MGAMSGVREHGQTGLVLVLRAAIATSVMTCLAVASQIFVIVHILSTESPFLEQNAFLAILVLLFDAAGGRNGGQRNLRIGVLVGQLVRMQRVWPSVVVVRVEISVAIRLAPALLGSAADQ